MKTMILMLTLGLSLSAFANSDDQVACTIQSSKFTAQYAAVTNKVTYVIATTNQPTQSGDGAAYYLMTKEELQKNDESAQQIAELGKSQGVDIAQVENVAIFTLVQTNDASMAILKFNGKNNQVLKTIFLGGWSAAACQ